MGTLCLKDGFGYKRSTKFQVLAQISNSSEGLTRCMLGNFSCFCCRLLTFQNKLFQKILSGTLSEYQTVWIQIRTYILSALIWIQTVCKGYRGCRLLTFQNELFQKIPSLTLSEHQMFWIQIKTNILSALICLQTICKGYQQTTKVAAARKEF